MPQLQKAPEVLTHGLIADRAPRRNKGRRGIPAHAATGLDAVQSAAIKGDLPGRCPSLRIDMDALPVNEQIAPQRSNTPQRMFQPAKAVRESRAAMIGDGTALALHARPDAHDTRGAPVPAEPDSSSNARVSSYFCAPVPVARIFIGSGQPEHDDPARNVQKQPDMACFAQSAIALTRMAAKSLSRIV